MMTFRVLENTITGVVEGKPFNITKTSETLAAIENFKKDNASSQEVLEYVKNSRNILIASECKYLMYTSSNKFYYLKYENKIYKEELPSALVKIIEESWEKKIDFLPVIKAWVRLLDNPRYDKNMGEYFVNYITTTFTDMEAAKSLSEEEDISLEEARNICTYSDLAITQEGLLATYKVAKEVTWEHVMEYDDDKETYTKKLKDRYKKIPAKLDSVTGEVLKEESWEKPEFKEDLLFTPAIWSDGDRFYSGKTLGYIYQVGQMQRLPKLAKRNLQNTHGGGGLYIGGLHYIDCFSGEGRQTLTCFVNPSDILSFQSEGHAIRTDALFINNIMDSDSKLKGMYHSSDYDKMSTERLDSILKDIAERNVKDFREESNIVTHIIESGDIEATDEVDSKTQRTIDKIAGK